MNQITTDLPARIKNIYSTCSDQEQVYLRTILEELADVGYSKTYEDIWLADYKEIPVDIWTFLSSDMYLGRATNNGKSIYPYWKKTLIEIFNAGNKYDEVIFTGATRIGKSSTAISAISYMLYRLMCLKDPQKFFGKKEVSKFSILFFNLTEKLAKGVAYREFNDTLKVSPWFNSHGSWSKSDRDFYYIPEGGKVVISYGSDSAHALGMQVFAACMDEIAFAKSGVKDIQKAKQSMMDTYNTISARIKGTFRQNGQVMGKLFAVSSKRSDSDFLESHIADIRNSSMEHVYIADKPQWEVLPPSMFSSQTFYLAVGDRHKKGFIVPDNQTDEASINDLKSQGYMILQPPIDLKRDFQADYDIALRDIAGLSVPGSLSYITQDYIEACIDPTHKNAFFNDIISIGTKDTLTLEEFFHAEVIDPRLKSCPMYIHLDLSLNTDRTGISGTCISGRKDVKGLDDKIISQIAFTQMFSVALQAPRGDKIPYSKIVEFICWLRRQGFNIARISRDQFQSEYVGQVLEAQGFTVDKISLDRTPDGYITLRSILLEQRVKMFRCEILEDELIHLQRDANTGKVDHPLGGGKDVADSFAGSIYNATLHNEGVPVPAKTVASAIRAVAASGNKNSYSRGNINSMFGNIKRI